MLVPRSWLADFAPDLLALDPVALGEVFDNLGMVVEAITRIGEGLDGVVVSRVLEIRAIPGADKIRQVFVDAGACGDRVEVVCGAWNFAEGDLVPLATVGAVLPGDFVIAQRRMKGVTSNGMLCSGRELNVGDDHAGILVLPTGLAPGTPFAQAMGITVDVVYDLAIESNRPEAMCIAGVARDAAAKLGLPFAIPVPAAARTAAAGTPTPTVTVDAPELCPRFTATVLTGVAVRPSPGWIAHRLTLAGMRPINNLVDASNYVMLELGQPTHPYDLDKLPGGGLGVRAAMAGESVVTLDEVERTLGTGKYPDAVITDGAGAAVGIAGVMGGASSEIDADSTTCLLEVAYFDRMAVARTSKRLGLRSEASARFERGTDPDGIFRAVARIAELLGASVGETVVVDSPAHFPNRSPLVVRTERVNALLGTALAAERMAELLDPIGFDTTVVEGGATLMVTLPSWRPDAIAEVDIAEEVARHHGYVSIERTVPRSPLVGCLSDLQRLRRTIRQILVGEGGVEAMTGMLVGPGDHLRAGLGEGEGITIDAVDPLAREESVLRIDLRPGLLRALSHNVGHRNPDVILFEVGHVYRHPLGPDGLPTEPELIGVVQGGGAGGAPAMVAILHSLAGALRIPIVIGATDTEPGTHPTRTALVISALDKGPLGVVGEIDPRVAAAHGIEGRVGWLGLDLHALLAAPREAEAAKSVGRFPSSDLDLAFVVPDTVPAAAVESTLRVTAGDLAESVALFDVYRGSGVEEGSRSLAFRLRLRSLERTLAETDLQGIRQTCIAAVTATHAATLRA